MPAIQTGYGVITIYAPVAHPVAEEVAVIGVLSQAPISTGPAPGPVIQYPTVTEEPAPVEAVAEATK